MMFHVEHPAAKITSPENAVFMGRETTPAGALAKKYIPAIGHAVKSSPHIQRQAFSPKQAVLRTAKGIFNTFSTFPQLFHVEHWGFSVFATFFRAGSVLYYQKADKTAGQEPAVSL